MKLQWMWSHHCLISLLRWIVISYFCTQTFASVSRRSVYWSLSSTLIALSIGSTTDQELDPSQFPRRLLLPYYHADVYGQPRRKFRFEEFLWAGSGDGPVSSESQDGMAWEDDNQSAVGVTPIKITKTMVLYKTVLSTVYPVGMTPVVVITSRVSLPISPTMVLEPSPTFSYEPNSQEASRILATDSNSILVEPTKIFTPTDSGGSNSGTSESINDKLSAASSDIRFWIQTVIRKKRGALHPNDITFQDSMQNKLAGIYATAFKRQLLRSLGIAGQKDNTINNNTNGFKRIRRRSPFTSINSMESDESDPTYFFLTEPGRVARTAMNVTVAMVNVSWSDPDYLIDMKYVVYAEGTPVPGFVAVKELRVVTVSEMKEELGYDIINKAEAIVQPNESYELGVSSSTPWMIALMTLVLLMIIILALTMFMAWKWKNNRLRDRNQGSPSVAEAGTTNSPVGNLREGVSALGQSERRISAGSLDSRVFNIDHEEDSNEGQGQHQQMRHHHERPQPLESPGDQFTFSDERGSSDMLLKSGEISSSYHSHSPRRRLAKPGGVSQKVCKRKRSRRRRTYTGQLEERSPWRHHHRNKENLNDVLGNEDPGNEFSFSNDLCRNMEKVSLGNLDICTEPEARVPSAQAKKIISRPSSHEHKRSETANVSSGVITPRIVSPDADIIYGEKNSKKYEDQYQSNTNEQDRDLSEKSFEVTDSASAEAYRKDAQVQTPTRLTRHSPRVRTSPRHRSSRSKPSKMSLLSTESEEAVEFTSIPHSSSDELNPLGRMRKRFHQFLDDAFNVMATGRKETTTKGPQSARVTVSHQMKTKAPGRPWTSHVIREESVRKIRPKSSVLLGPPKSAWDIGSERRCQSARSKKSTIDDGIPQKYEGSIEDLEKHDTPVLSNSRSSSVVRQSLSEQSQQMMFPKYSSYPEVTICLEDDPNRTAIPGSSHSTRSGLHPVDPAVPLIEAIKDEMKRFEKVKVSCHKDSESFKH